MNSILHKIVIETSPDSLLQALNSEEGLSNWWTKAEKSNDGIRLFFGSKEKHKVLMNLIDTPNIREVKWQCTEGPWAEKGEFVFSISPHERGSSLDFAHHGWPDTDDFFKHCNAKWGFFLAVSLKQYLETGKGQPHPNEPNI